MDGARDGRYHDGVPLGFEDIFWVFSRIDDVHETSPEQAGCRSFHYMFSNHSFFVF